MKMRAARDFTRSIFDKLGAISDPKGWPVIAKEDVPHRVWIQRSGFAVYLHVELTNNSPTRVDATIPFDVYDGDDGLKSHGHLVFADVKTGETAQERRLLYFDGDGPRTASVDTMMLYKAGHVRPHRGSISGDASARLPVSTRTTALLLLFSVIVMLYALARATIIPSA
jgi:hypothetical protein